MKYIQSIVAVLVFALGVAACSTGESPDGFVDNASTDGVLRLLPVAPPTYGTTTRVTTDGTNWTEGDVAFMRITFYADEAMTQMNSFIYTAVCYHEDEGWVAARSKAEGDEMPDFTFKVVGGGANDALWSDKLTVLWPLKEAKAAKIEAVYAGLEPVVELLDGGEARIAVNDARVGETEMLTVAFSLLQTDLTDQPVKMNFSHRLLRLDIGKELEQNIRLTSGSSGSGVNIVPQAIDFSGVVRATNTIGIPAGSRYFYIAPDQMWQGAATREFRLEDDNAVIATFTLPEKPANDTRPGGAYYYGRSYSLNTHNGGLITPDDMTGI